MKKIFITALLVGTFSLSYAQSDYYNDYRRSISDVNWQTVAADLLLSTTQTKQLYSLNDRYHDYNSWTKVYVHNPDRWRDDRYTEIERIMGREKYMKFKTKYYKGQNPTVVYTRNKNDDKRYQHMTKKSKSYRQQDNDRDHNH